MNAPVTVLKSPRPEAVAASLISEDLARFAGAFSTDRIPAAVTARAKHLTLDAAGIALASTTYDFAHRAMTAISGLAGPGDSAVIGMPARLPLRDAALEFGARKARDVLEFAQVRALHDAPQDGGVGRRHHVELEARRFQ